MTQNSGSTKYAPGYDLFKLIVAVILTIILIFLLLQESRIQNAGLSLTITAPPATEQVVLPTMTLQPPPTSSPTGTPTSTPEPSPTVTESIPTESTPIEPTPTELIPTAQPTPTEPAPTQAILSSDPNACPANPTRIQVGATVRVLDWLNFRTGPGLHNEIQQTNRPGTEMEVIGGPVCTIKGKGDPPRAYLWWNVRLENGQEGWSAEAPLNFPNYFLEPIQ